MTEMDRQSPQRPGRNTAPSIGKSSGDTATSERCDVCGAPTFELHCKVICRHCGYIRDCSDP